MFTEKQKKALRDFARSCYWHGENTGDYDMADIDELLVDLWQEIKGTALFHGEIYAYMGAPPENPEDYPSLEDFDISFKI